MRAVSKHFALGHSRGQDRIKPYGRGVELICYVREIGRPNHVALETQREIVRTGRPSAGPNPESSPEGGLPQIE